MHMRSRQSQDDELVADPAEIEAMLRDSLDRWGIEMTGDQRVFEDSAARLLGYSALYLRNRRTEGKGPRAIKVGGRISYRLPDIARWIADNTELC
jgi:hypothetical protein